MSNSVSEQKTFVINTMTAEKYEDLSAKGLIKADELNIVDDDNQNRTVIPSYDMLKKLTGLGLAYVEEDGKHFICLSSGAGQKINADQFLKDGMLNGIDVTSTGLVFTVSADGGDASSASKINVEFIDQGLSSDSQRAVSNKAVTNKFSSIDDTISRINKTILGFDQKINLLSDSIPASVQTVEQLEAELPADKQNENDTVKVIQANKTAIYYTVKDEDGIKTWTETKREEAAFVATENVDVSTEEFAKLYAGTKNLKAGDISYNRLSDDTHVPSSKFLSEILSGINDEMAAKADAEDLESYALSGDVDSISAGLQEKIDGKVDQTAYNEKVESIESEILARTTSSDFNSLTATVNTISTNYIDGEKLDTRVEQISADEKTCEASYTVASVSQKNGIVSVTYQEISIALSQVSGLASKIAAYDLLSSYDEMKTALSADGYALSGDVKSGINTLNNTLTAHTATKSGNPHNVKASDISSYLCSETSSAAELGNKFDTLSTYAEVRSQLSNDGYALKSETSSAAELDTKFNTLSTYAQVGAQLSNDGYAMSALVTAHTGLTNNPHGVTAHQAGAYISSETSSAAELKSKFDTLSTYDQTAQQLSVDGYAVSADVDGTVRAVSSDLCRSLSAEIKKQEDAETGYFATYQLYQDGGPVGEKINIPKDFLVRSGSVEKCIENDKPIEGLAAGDKYLDFVVNAISDEDGEAKHIYIDVKDLVDVYTGGSTDSVSVAVGDRNEISAVVLEKGVTKEMLADGVNDLISSQWLSARDYADVKIRGLSTENLTCPAGKTVSAVTEASGVIGVSFQDILITSAQVQGLTAALDDRYVKSETSSAIELSDKFNSLSASLSCDASCTVAKLVQEDGVVSAKFKAISIDIDHVAGLREKVDGYDRLSTYAETSAQLSNDGYATKSDVDAADAALSAAIDGKVRIDDLSAATLDVKHVDSQEYHNMVKNGTLDEDTLYVVSSDTFSAYGEKIVNVATPTDNTDAANKKYVDDKVDSMTKSLSVEDMAGATDKTVTMLTETGGKVSAKFELISITTSQVSGLPSKIATYDKLSSYEQIGSHLSNDGYALMSQTSSATKLQEKFDTLSTYAEISSQLSSDGYATTGQLNDHAGKKDNPHNVTATQTGAYLSSQTSSDAQLQKAFAGQTQAMGAIVSGLWNALSGKAYTVDDKGLSVLKTANSMTCRDLAESILSVMSFVSCWWAKYELTEAVRKI